MSARPPSMGTVRYSFAKLSGWSLLAHVHAHNLVPRAMPVRGLGWHWLWGN
jgi:hypothetical protein